MKSRSNRAQAIPPSPIDRFIMNECADLSSRLRMAESIVDIRSRGNTFHFAFGLRISARMSDLPGARSSSR